MTVSWKPRASLHSCIANLRRILEPARAPRTASRVLLGSPAGYALLLAEDDAPAYGDPLCEHIRSAAASPIDHYLHYTGEGVERRRLCGLCRNEAATAVTAEVCEECFDATDSGPMGVIGRPRTVEAPRPIPGTVETLTLPDRAGTVLDFAATSAGVLLLGDDGRIRCWDTRSGACTEVARTTVAVPGEVIDLATGRVTMSLENDGYTARPFRSRCRSPSTKGAPASCTAARGGPSKRPIPLPARRWPRFRSARRRRPGRGASTARCT